MRDAGETPRRCYSLAMVTQQDDRLIGRCGFDLGGPDMPEGMLGYALHRDLWGQGYTTEAVRALIGFGFGTLGLHRMWADADPRNVGSWRVMEKVGMRREGHLLENYLFNGDWTDSYLYAILTREWS
jgi:[ribosomal protein S5]-alanine N-acetyltransferase